ncbi:F-box only protein 8-like [Papaver somniferum]|uniref:F-box only protein 8-like n=1 Tax=Papaver somniferum TaxID=3469 RepID=UPI000E6F7B5E|nr:F-box only protein 8-like [Papaver somniferum]
MAHPTYGCAKILNVRVKITISFYTALKPHFLPGFHSSISIMDYFRFLSLEMTLEILTRLPTELVLECKSVCIDWRSLVGHPSFSKLHLHRLNHPDAESGKSDFLVLTCGHDGLYYLEYDENHDHSTTPMQRITRIDFTSPFKYFGFRFVGSVNGLLCFIDFINQPICVCNPITREYVILPEIKRDCDTDGYSYGETNFDYVFSTNEYKVIGFYKSKTHFEVYIYILSSGNGWRNLGKFNCGSSLYLKCKVFFVNGALYWLDNELKMIGTFGLADEKFGGQLLPPPLSPNGEWLNYRIGVLDRFFFLSLYEKVDGFHDIWLLKEKNLNHDKEERKEHQSLVWNEEFRINKMDLLAVMKSGAVFTYGGGKYINLYDTKTSTSKSLVKFKNWILGESTHKNTLVSLKKLGEEDTKIMESVNSREQPQEDANPEYIYL